MMADTARAGVPSFQAAPAAQQQPAVAPAAAPDGFAIAGLACRATKRDPVQASNALDLDSRDEPRAAVAWPRDLNDLRKNAPR